MVRRLLTAILATLTAGICLACCCPAPPSSKSSSTEKTWQVGRTYSIDSGAERTPVCDSKQTLREVTAAIDEGNEAVVSGFLARGKVRAVAQGSRVKFLDHDGMAAQVMVLDGEHASHKGWVYLDWLK